MRLSNLIKKFSDRIKSTYVGEAAVSILLSDDREGVKIFLVKRASRENDPWSSQMAFPGGRKSQSDSNLLETVMRETLEETGIDLKKWLFLGALEPIKSTLIPEFNVLPFVFYCQEKPKVTLNEELVSSFWVSLEELCNSSISTRIGSLDVRGYLIQGELVWGLTFRMLEKFFELINASPKQ
jgi:8-oxo-dGTP pyrophosphatase MutT (NUDIX family)